MSVKMEINLTVILMFLTAMLFGDVQTSATTAQSVTPSPSPANHEITPTNATTVSTDPHAAITKLFSDYTEWKLSVFPEYASEVGFHQFDAHLSDASVAGAARHAHVKAVRFGNDYKVLGGRDRRRFMVSYRYGRVECRQKPIAQVG